MGITNEEDMTPNPHTEMGRRKIEKDAEEQHQEAAAKAHQNELEEKMRGQGARVGMRTDERGVVKVKRRGSTKRVRVEKTRQTKFNPCVGGVVSWGLHSISTSPRAKKTKQAREEKKRRRGMDNRGKEEESKVEQKYSGSEKYKTVAGVDTSTYKASRDDKARTLSIRQGEGGGT